MTAVGIAEYDAIQKAAADLSAMMATIYSSVEALTTHVSLAVGPGAAEKKGAVGVQELKAMEKKALTLATSFSQAIEELCVGLCSNVAANPNSTIVVEKKPEAAPVVPAPATKKPDRDLTVPPPQPPPPAPTNWKSVASPNAALARAMAGRTAEWDRIRRMAEQIRSPTYLLKNFFEDCVASFPELGLFFEGPSVAHSQHSLALSSGRSGEAEYQRTVGALFVVYWMLRLDIDGRSGFCYGVDENWQKVDIPPPREVKGSFFKMNADEKRASASQTMNWPQFQELVDRAGCGSSSPGSTERIMALLCLTSFHDIMKVPTMQPIVQPEHAPYHGVEAGVRINDHDLALSYVMDQFPHLLPSFDGLPPDAKRGVLLTQREMQFNHGWFVQAEAPPGGMLSQFKRVLTAGANQPDIDLYFLHWITDLAGACATPLGGAEKLVLNFPHHVLASFLWSMPYLSKLTEVSETALVEGYLEARWAALLPSEPVPDDSSSIALMRLVVMAQCEDAMTVVNAFRKLPLADQSCLIAELSRTGCAGQHYVRHAVSGGPAFLIYYSPALLQRNNKSADLMEAALHCLCVVLRAARAVWPLSPTNQSNTVIIQVAELKSRDIVEVISDPGGDTRLAWLLTKNNEQEGEVTLVKPSEINSLHLEGSQFRVLDFAIEAAKNEYKSAAAGKKPVVAAQGMAMTRKATDSGDYADGPRILVFTDMSTECDDECALLWLVQALGRQPGSSTVELVVTDSHARFQWMAHIFSDKFQSEWEIRDKGYVFVCGNVRVRMYLSQSQQDEHVCNDITGKCKELELETETKDGHKIAVWKKCIIGGKVYTDVPPGSLDAIVVAAAPNDVDPEFFKRFTTCKCAYVVGTPGGINCPMPAWTGILAALHRICPVLYLTPQFTRSVRFPRQYVKTNPHWNECIRNTVWGAALCFMAKRPELPCSFGSWGLVLRLNIANAIFCKDWYFDVNGTKVEDAPRPDYIVKWVQNYVERNSGDDRQQGAVLDELRNIGVDVSPWGLGLSKADQDETGKLTSPAAKEAIRKRYRQELFDQTIICVVTTDTLLFQNKRNFKVSADAAGYEELRAQCGYSQPEENLCELFGMDFAAQLVKELPLRWLTPAYDVVAMICADASLDEGTEVDGGLGLLIADADNTMGLGLLSEEQRNASNHPVLMTLPQMGEGIYRVGPFS